MERLLVQADYLDRQGRRELAALLRATIERARSVELLNDFTKDVLADVADVELPDGFEIVVSASSDVVLAGPDGHWIGLRSTGRRPPGYEAWRGSIYRVPVRFPTLEAAVRYYCRTGQRKTVPDPD